MAKTVSTVEMVVSENYRYVEQLQFKMHFKVEIKLLSLVKYSSRKYRSQQHGLASELEIMAKSVW